MRSTRDTQRRRNLGLVVTLCLAASVAFPAPYVELRKLTAADAAPDDVFGSAVDVDGSMAVVGAPNDDDNGTESGAAYVFMRNAGGVDGWSQVAKLTAADGEAFDLFGIGVAIDGDRIAVGAALNNNLGIDSGAIYVFERNAGGSDAWGQVAKVTAADPASFRLGTSVAISGGTLVAGAAHAEGESGAAFVFRRDFGGEDNWGQVAKLVAPAGSTDKFFGRAAAIDGHTVVVSSAFGDPTEATNGSAYVFERNAGGADAWGQVATLTSEVTTDQRFGDAVAIDSDRVVVGARLDSTTRSSAGAAYLFERNTGGRDAWGQVVKLFAPEPNVGDGFGVSVGIEGGRIVVGAELGDAIVGMNTGFAHVFERNVGEEDGWGVFATLRAADAAPGDSLAASAAISGDTILLGARLDDDGGDRSGSAYVFAEGACGWEETAKTFTEDGVRLERFAFAVALDDGTAVAGSPNFFSDTGGGMVSILERNAGGPDAWGEVVRLTPTDGHPMNDYGRSVDIYGDLVFVGAPADAPTGDAMGGAYLYQRNAGGPDGWGEVTKLRALDASAGAEFGYQVALGSDTAVVGARRDGALATRAGAVYVFERNAGGVDEWAQVAKLVASDYRFGSFFGQAVAIEGNTIVVGAPRANGVSLRTGAAYVFEREATGPDGWVETAILTADDATTGAFFGEAVAISGTTVAVTASRDDDFGTLSGAVYVFERNAGGADRWGQVAKLTSSDGAAEDVFGLYVSVSDNRMASGAHTKDTFGVKSGAAYVFEREPGDAGSWVEVLRLDPSEPRFRNFFGLGIAIDGNTTIVGAAAADGNDFRAGAAFVFDRSACPGCGDGEISSPEECDDGNVADGDGCDSRCRLEVGACCLEGAEEECLILDGPTCVGQGGHYQGNRTNCDATSCVPLLVDYTVLGARLTADGVLIHWTTAMEVDNVGFRILRQRGGREKTPDVLVDFVPAAGSPLAGATYEVLDGERQDWDDVNYYVEDIDYFGRVTRHGPIRLASW